MENIPTQFESLEAALIKKFGLVAGQKVAFEKVKIHSQSAIPIGSVVEGTLKNDVGVGSVIEFEGSDKTISNIHNIEEKDGDVYLVTATSTYRLVQESEEDNTPEDLNLEDIEAVVTAKGSVYRYLPDGRTQRFKNAEGKDYEAQSALVYVPDFNWVKENAPAKVLEILGDNEVLYGQTLLEYVQGKGKKCYIVDSTGKKLETNEQIEASGGPIFLTFGDENKVDFYIPVSHKPRLGYYTYDTKKYQDENSGEWLRDSHMGNKVVKIIRKKAKENNE